MVDFVGHELCFVCCIGALDSFGVGFVSMKSSDGFSNLDCRWTKMGYHLVSHKNEEHWPPQKRLLGRKDRIGHYGTD